MHEPTCGARCDACSCRRMSRSRHDEVVVIIIIIINYDHNYYRIVVVAVRTYVRSSK